MVKTVWVRKQALDVMKLMTAEVNAAQFAAIGPHATYCCSSNTLHVALSQLPHAMLSSWRWNTFASDRQTCTSFTCSLSRPWCLVRASMIMHMQPGNLTATHQPVWTTYTIIMPAVAFDTGCMPCNSAWEPVQCRFDKSARECCLQAMQNSKAWFHRKGCCWGILAAVTTL